MGFSIPQEVKDVAAVLEHAGFEAYLVGGCVRDLILGVEPKDWDIATDATPTEIQNIFASFMGSTEEAPGTVYENTFGTVGVKTGSSNERLKIIEVTTYRIEGAYRDRRHPDVVRFAKTIEEDLSRRDFTVNAMALSVTSDKRQETSGKKNLFHVTGDSFLIDPFGGQMDLKKKIIRTVGNPADRFSEDALRLMRAVRFAVELDFTLESATSHAIFEHAGLLEMIAKERVRDELVKMLVASRAAVGIRILEELGLLKYILPELREGINVGQNKHHIYSVFEHNVRALDYTAKKGYSLVVRMASLLHDVGKPRVKQGDGPDSTFYNHDAVGAKMALMMLDRLHFGRDFVEDVAHLVRHHLFYYNVGEVSDAGVRRFLRRVGTQYLDDLLKVREADRIGSGVPKAVPYKTRHLLYMIEKVRHDPISAKMLKVNGEDVMRLIGQPPGPYVGQILAILLEEVIDDPTRNKREYLEPRISELAGLSDDVRAAMMQRAREAASTAQSATEQEMKKKFYVQ